MVFELRIHHSNHRVRSIVQSDGAADKVRVRAKALLPQAVTDNGYWGRAWCVVFFRKVASDHWRKTHNPEVIMSDHARIETLGLAGTRQIHRPPAKERHAFKRLIARAPIL